MGRCTFFIALALFAVLPALGLADVPGGPPAVPPDCPPGTRLEGPYRYWRCVPVTPDPSVPVIDDPAPPLEPNVAPAQPPVEVQAAPPAAEPAPARAPAAEGWHTTAGCTVGSGSNGGAAWMLVALIGLAARRRARG